MNNALVELQDSAAAKEQQQGQKQKRQCIRYSDEEWKILAQAMLAEMFAKPANIGLNIIHIANQAQKNQTKILSPQWPARHFTGVVQLNLVMPHMHRLYADLQEQANLFRTASDETKSCQEQLKTANATITQMKTKKASLSEFPPAEIVAEAAFIQAQQAEKLETAAASVAKGIEELKRIALESKSETTEAINYSKHQISQKVDALTEEISSFKPQLAGAQSRPQLVATGVGSGNGNGNGHHANGNGKRSYGRRK